MDSENGHKRKHTLIAQAGKSGFEVCGVEDIECIETYQRPQKEVFVGQLLDRNWKKCFLLIRPGKLDLNVLFWFSYLFNLHARRWSLFIIHY